LQYNHIGNEEAYSLAKKAGKLTQTDMGVSYQEAMIKNRYNGKLEKEHQGYNKEDGYYQFTREEQVIIFQLCTGHNRLKQHMFGKLRIGTTDV
jgi:hypothetical protein